MLKFLIQNYITDEFVPPPEGHRPPLHGAPAPEIQHPGASFLNWLI